ncbi:MAG: DUF2946 domain-containing protein [Paucibacter sp.]|nr:DUF2946 domain-containing protein [Roseateles sp.]
MHFRWVHRVWVSWVACAAILLSALAPAISHAVVQRDAADVWVEICSVTGAKLVRLDTGSASAVDSQQADSPPPHESTPVHTYKHCPYCAIHSDGLGLPPPAMAEPALLSLGHAVPALFLHAPRTLFAWASAQPRAPPLNS